MPAKIKDDFKIIALLALLCGIFFVAGGGILSLTNPDEVFYAQTAKEMAERSSWMTPYLFGEPQFEKPIFTYWLIRIGFALFGVTSFGARFFPAVWALLGVLGTYFLGLLGFGDRKKAFLAALVLMSSGLYFGLARTVFTDMFFSVFILLSLLSFYWAYNRSFCGCGIVGFYFFAALAVLTKGPLGILLPLLTVLLFLTLRRQLGFFFSRSSFLGFCVFCIMALPWYIFMVKEYGRDFIAEFFYNDHIRRVLEAEHLANDRWYFYPLSIVGCMFPWSLFLLFALIRFVGRLRKNPSALEVFLACWISVIFVVFQTAHSKLVSYVVPLFPALALLAADYIEEALKGATRAFFAIAWLATWCVLLAIPIGLVAASRMFASHVVSVRPIFVFGLLFVSYILALLFFFLRRRRRVVVYALAPVLPFLLIFAFSRINDFEAHVSSREACAYLLEHHQPDRVILTSKFFARGVRYYTDKDIAVLDISGKGFFSPHPIPYLKTHGEVRDFLGRRQVTYAILRPSYGKDIQRIVGAGFAAEVLRVLGDAYVVRIMKL